MEKDYATKILEMNYKSSIKRRGLKLRLGLSKDGIGASLDIQPAEIDKKHLETYTYYGMCTNLLDYVNKLFLENNKVSHNLTKLCNTYKDRLTPELLKLIKETGDATDMINILLKSLRPLIDNVCQRAYSTLDKDLKLAVKEVERSRKIHKSSQDQNKGKKALKDNDIKELP